MYPLNDLLTGRHTLQDFLSHTRIRNPLGEILGYLEVDVSLKQGHPHFAHGILDVLFRQLPVTTKRLEYALKRVGK